MNTDKKYKGWTNYKTWYVALWLDNEQGSYDHWRERAIEILAAAEPSFKSDTKEDSAKRDMADALKDEITESAPDLGASMFSDFINAALSEVNWYEIAEHYIAQAIEESKEVA